MTRTFSPPPRWRPLKTPLLLLSVALAPGMAGTGASPLQGQTPQRDALLERFLRASARATLEPLEDLMGREVQLWTDGGGVVPAALRIIEGPERVARFLLEMAARARPGTALVRGVVNADPALLVLARGRVSTTITAVAGPGGRIQRILMVRNPAKLARARLPRPPAPVEV